MANQVTLELTATATSGDILHPFYIRKKLNHFVNDSAMFDCQVNFDGEIGQHGTFTVRAGEIVTDLDIQCRTLSVQGIGGNVAFRALGV